MLPRQLLRPSLHLEAGLALALMLTPGAAPAETAAPADAHPGLL